MKSFYKVLILGGGAGGISLASRIRKKTEQGSIAIVDPSSEHFYQPLWTIAGAGLVKKETTKRRQSDLIPSGVKWLQSSVTRIDPERKTVFLNTGEEVEFEFLVVATGLRLAWEKIKGLEGSLGKNGICSIYEYGQVDATSQMIQSFAGGEAVFVMPQVPIKCAGAPQKIMYLAENIFRKNGVRNNSRIRYVTAGKAMFGIPVFAAALAKLVKDKNIEPVYSHHLVAVRPESREAIFTTTEADGTAREVTMKFDLLHVVPPQAAHAFVVDSGLSARDGEQKGWLEVDKHSLQHLRYPFIFGIGDVTGVPNSKTGAAIRKQAPVVAANLLSVIAGEKPNAKYDGYSSCPLVTEVGKVMLAEFGYDGN